MCTKECVLALMDKVVAADHSGVVVTSIYTLAVIQWYLVNQQCCLVTIYNLHKVVLIQSFLCFICIYRTTSIIFTLVKSL